MLALGRLYSFTKAGTIGWSAAVSGPASVQGPDMLAAADQATVYRLAGATGEVAARVALSPALTGAYRAFEVGNGLLMAGADLRMYQ